MFNNEPLMYIDSNPKTKGNNGQEIYDSRKVSKIVKKEEKEINTLNVKEIQKLQNMVKLYNNKKTVICKIITDSEEIECVPVKMEDEKVYVKRTDMSVNDIKLNDILSVEIVYI